MKGLKEENEIAMKFLTFSLSNELYGVEILKIQEIIGLLDITSVPKTPKFVKGVVNLRGKVIPVIDMRIKFEMPEKEYTRDTCIIILDIDSKLMGIIVDSVNEVLNIIPENIEETPSFGIKLNTEFIQGIGKFGEKGDKVVILLDINKVLTSEEFVLLQNIS